MGAVGYGNKAVTGTLAKKAQIARKPRVAPNTNKPGKAGPSVKRVLAKTK